MKARLREERRGIILRGRKKRKLVTLSKEEIEALDNYFKEEEDKEQKEIDKAWEQHERMMEEADEKDRDRVELEGDFEDFYDEPREINLGDSSGGFKIYE
jgi:DNA repair ATPase RecN